MSTSTWVGGRSCSSQRARSRLTRIWLDARVHAHVGRGQRALAHGGVRREQAACLEVAYRGLQRGVVELRIGAGVRREVAAGEQALAQQRDPRRVFAGAQRGAFGDLRPAAARGDVAVLGQPALQALVDGALRGQALQRARDIAGVHRRGELRDGSGAQFRAVQVDFRLDAERIELAAQVVGGEAYQRIAAQQLHARSPGGLVGRCRQQRGEVVVGGPQPLALDALHGGEQVRARCGIPSTPAVAPGRRRTRAAARVAHARGADAQLPVLRELRQRARQGVVGAQRRGREGSEQHGEKRRVQDARH